MARHGSNEIERRLHAGLFASIVMNQEKNVLHFSLHANGAVGRRE